jgi:4-hydroxy-tetrahydrodipicolinate reductase
MKIALLGYGKMGKTIERIALERGHSIVFKSSSNTSEGNIKKADLAIEFSTPITAIANIKSCMEIDLPVVSGTTGWMEHFDQIIKFCEDSNGSFLYASNFSIGVNLFFEVNERLAQLMQSHSEYSVSVEEIHHAQKKDAPSGTAISIAEGILKYSKKKSWKLNSENEDMLPIFAKRIDDVKGTHTVTYDSEIDSITMKHEAHTRDGFAIGAVLAAEWLLGKKGVYSMKDVLQINK